LRESIIAFNQGIEASIKHPSFDVEVDWVGFEPRLKWRYHPKIPSFSINREFEKKNNAFLKNQ
jgi:hypothetical protein